MAVDEYLALEEKYRYRASIALFNQQPIKYKVYSILEHYYEIRHEEQVLECKSSWFKRLKEAIKMST